MILQNVSMKVGVGAGRFKISGSPGTFLGFPEVALSPHGMGNKRRHVQYRTHICRHNKQVVFSSSPYKDPYDLLGVKRSATMKEIKQAYRRKALKLHPDVNKAPDAKEKFMECKNAYQEIMDGRKRPNVDRNTNQTKREDTYGWKQPPSEKKQASEPEEFYGLGDLFRDLENEWKNKSKQSNEPKDLWEELADIGEEFVEFLEKGIGISEDTDTSTTETWERRTEPGTNTTKESTRTTSKIKNVDEELEELKRKMGL